MRQLKLLIILGGMATLAAEIYQYIYIWLPKFHEITSNSENLKLNTILGPILILTGLIACGSFFYALKNSRTGFVLLTSGAVLLTPPYLIIAILAGLYQQDLLGAVKLALPGIFALTTFLLALYNKSEYETQ